MKANFVIIAGKNLINNFMQCADLFEKGKVVGKIEELSIDFECDESKKWENIEKMIDGIKMALIEAKRNVSFIHLLNISTDECEWKNTKCFAKPYYDKSVRIISNGHEFFMLDEFIRKLGLKCETDEWRFITKIGE